MEDLIEGRIGKRLTGLHLTLSVAESCTGGLVGSRLTDVAGSSIYFLGGVIAYSNDSKVKFLNVQPETLAAYGAVSEQTAREMAEGVRKRFGADIGLSITGIAGPGGATEDKPVGLIWLALAAADGTRVISVRLTGDRLHNKAAAAGRLLELLNDYLENFPPN